MQKLGWAIHYLRKHTLESFLIILTMSIGVAVLTTVLTVFMGLSRQMDSFLDDAYYRLFTIREQSMQREISFRSSPPITPFIESSTSLAMGIADVEEITEGLPDGIMVFPALQSNFLASQPRRTEFSVIGTNAAFYDFYRFPFISGNWFFADDVQAGNPVIVLNFQVAEHLFGSTDVVGQTISLSGTNTSVDYTVIGVLDRDINVPSGYNSAREALVAYVPVGSPLFLDPTFSSLSVGIESGMNPTTALEHIRSVVDLQFDGNAVTIGNLTEYQEMVAVITPILRLIGLFASVGLIIAVVNILNLMLARVLRRVKHVGIHMALGSTRPAIFGLFFTEAIVLGITSSILGVTISYFLEPLLLNIWSVMVYPISMPVRIVVGMSIGIISSAVFGIYPATQVTRIDIGQALRAEGR